MALLLREYLLQDCFGDAKLELWYSGENDFCGILLADCFEIPGNHFIHVSQVGETQFDIKWIEEPFDGSTMEALLHDVYNSHRGTNSLDTFGELGFSINQRYVSLQFHVTR